MTRHFGDPYAGVADPYLRRACELAELGRGTTSPNPLVGCVMVRDGQVVGEGWHERAGGPHAEIRALESAGETACGATAYVTLEPCAHTGRTGPCADALVAAGVARVVIGMPDPHRIAAGGAVWLRRAGIEVEFAQDPAPYEELNVEWLHALRTGRPFVRVKVAVTLDARPALADGVRSSLTGMAVGELTMRLRSQSDAVMVGATTAAIDDPGLTVRGDDGTPAPRQPRRVVLTRTEQPRPGLRMFADGLGPVTVLVPSAVDVDPALLAEGAMPLSYDIAEGLRGALAALHGSDIMSLLVEAGPRLLTSLVGDGLVDELVLAHAGGFAGESAPALFVGGQPEDTATLVRGMRASEAAVVGTDAVTVWRPRHAPHATV